MGGIFCCCFFFTNLKTSINNFIPVHITVISPHHRRLCFYFWTFVCSNCDIFHLLGTDKCRCKSILAQNRHNHLNRLLYLYKCKYDLVKSQMTFDLESRQEGVIHVFFPTKLQTTLRRGLCKMARYQT